MKKITFIFIALVFFTFLVSCYRHGAASWEIQVEVIDFPFEEYDNRHLWIAVYVFRKGNDFVEPIAQPRLHPKRGGRRGNIFDYPLRKDRDYRVVVNNSVVFDITDLRFRATESRRRWEIVSMKINGVLLNEEDLINLRIMQELEAHRLWLEVYVPLSEEELQQNLQQSEENLRERPPHLPHFLLLPYSMGRIVHND